MGMMGMNADSAMSQSIQKMGEFTQMLDMSTFFLESMQEQCGHLYGRLGEVLGWANSVRDYYLIKLPNEPVEELTVKDEEDRQKKLHRCKKRLFALFAMLLFLFYCAWRKHKKRFPADWTPLFYDLGGKWMQGASSAAAGALGAGIARGAYGNPYGSNNNNQQQQGGMYGQQQGMYGQQQGMYGGGGYGQQGMYGGGYGGSSSSGYYP